MNITIEKTTPADAAALIEYLKQVGAETDNLTFGAEGLPFTVEAEAEYIAQLEHSRNSIMLVAKEDGRIVGNASLDRLPRRMSHRGDFAITVVKTHWNRGIGGRLLEKILAFARENSFEIIDLQVRSDNLAAIHLYEKFGFQKLGTHPGFLKIDGRDVDVDYMYLKLK